MNPELAYFATYPCPRCHLELESDSDGPPSWLRCPRCGRASLTPEVVRRSSMAESLEPSHEIHRDQADRAEPDPLRPRAMAARPAEAPSKTPTLRLILGIAFFLAVLVFVFSVLSGEGIQAAISGVAAGVLLFFLARPSRATPLV